VTSRRPAAGALYKTPWRLSFSLAIAQAKAEDHPIAKVEFFQGQVLVGSGHLPAGGDQYTLSWTEWQRQLFAHAKATKRQGRRRLCRSGFDHRERPCRAFADLAPGR